MKIVYITAGAGGMICGNCLRDNTLARALISLGHEVHLIPTYTPIRTDELDVSLPRVFYGGINIYLHQKFPLLRNTPRFLGRLLERPRLLRWASQFAVKTRPEELGALTVSVLEGAHGPQARELRDLIHWLKQTSPQVAHLTNSLFAGMAPAIKDELGLPVVCSLQGEDYFLSHLPSPYRERAHELLRQHASSVDAFLAPSRDHAAAMAPLLGVAESEIGVVLSGLDLEGFRERTARNSDEFVIGYLARVAPEKGLHLLAEALHRIRSIRSRRGAKKPRCRLRVAGWIGPEHRPYLEDIRRQVRGWGFEESFDFLGTLDRAEKLRFLAGLDVLSVPVSYRAPKGLYVLEALAAGVPVVQPRIGVFPELIEATGGGLLFEPGDAEGFADALERLIDDPAEAERMGRQGRRAVQEMFHSRRLAEETVALYEQILSKVS